MQVNMRDVTIIAGVAAGLAVLEFILLRKMGVK